MKNQLKIHPSAIDPCGVPLYLSHGDNEMSAFNLACDFCRQHDYNSWRMNTHGLYLLRGTVTDKEDLLFALLEVPQLPEPLEEVLNYLQFYNQHGRQIFRTASRKGEDYRDCILRHMLQDCSLVVSNAGEGYSCGAGQSHVWIGERFSSKRMLLVHF